MPRIAVIMLTAHVKVHHVYQTFVSTERYVSARSCGLWFSSCPELPSLVSTFAVQCKKAINGSNFQMHTARCECTAIRRQPESLAKELKSHGVCHGIDVMPLPRNTPARLYAWGSTKSKYMQS